MNPYFHNLYLIPGCIAFLSAFLTNKIIRFISIIISTIVFWYLLQKSVDWAYTHPEIEPNDGGPRSFAALFGWLIGLITVILPIHFIARFMLKKVKKRIKH
jgi:hypothetical protein